MKPGEKRGHKFCFGEMYVQLVKNSRKLTCLSCKNPLNPDLKNMHPHTTESRTELTKQMTRWRFV